MNTGRPSASSRARSREKKLNVFTGVEIMIMALFSISSSGTTIS
jgi:hypothetical protein